MIVHDFHDSLAKSHTAEDLPFWEECYRNAFGDSFASMISHRTNGEWQHAGIDRSVILTNSKQLLIDEKVRWKAWDDICLEYVSNDVYETPGWVCKPLRADYIAYAIAPLGKCYMLPVIQLQTAWRLCGPLWLKSADDGQAGFKIIKALNANYTTLSLAMPVATLFKEIGAALRVTFTPYTEAGS